MSHEMLAFHSYIKKNYIPFSFVGVLQNPFRKFSQTVLFYILIPLYSQFPLFLRQIEECICIWSVTVMHLSFNLLAFCPLFFLTVAIWKRTEHMFSGEEGEKIVLPSLHVSK
jgi:hypothetical protein